MVGLLTWGGYNLHVYAEGENSEDPDLVFLSGSATVAPVYDFKPLYRLLSDEYTIAVVEKAGYSDIIKVNRNVDTMINEVRNALAGAGISAQFILIPHSMSGLEAIYWAQNRPDEVAGIVGLDRAVAYSYDDMDFNRMNQMIDLGKTAVKLGLLRIPGLYPLNENGLTDEEIYQQKWLLYKNAGNLDYILEGQAVYENAQVVKAGDDVSCPIIMFSSDGTETGDSWIQSQEKYPEEHRADRIVFDCGHDLHYYKSEEMAWTIQRFIEEMHQTK